MAADLLSLWHVLLGEALFAAAGIVLLMGLDDLAIDGVFFARLLWRRLTVYTRHPRARAEQLCRPAPGPMAILIPAWDEAGVIGRMLAELLRRLDYPDYRVFVGLYANDPATVAVVRAMADPRIEAVVGARPGPTTKADCLNRLWPAVRRHEAVTGRRFKGVVLHDAEDVVHPLELRVFDALLPRLSMVQLPVRPLPDPASPWIAGHYLDEFAEMHAKELVVREALGAAVPSAGVGCAIDRDMLDAIAGAAGGRPFDPASLTEDYELGHRLHALGGRGALVRIRGGDDRVMVATAEHFPADLDAAIRQKARWLAGIALAGWDRIGWRGGAATRWMLVRDRKGLLAAVLTMLAWLLALALLIDAALRALLPAAAQLPPATAGGTATLLAINGVLLIWRLLMRAGFTAHAYGWREGLRAVPRAVAGNAINALAAIVAMRRYWRSLRGAPLAWEKTRHRYPDAP